MKIYEKISRKVLLLLILIVSIFFTACPAPSSNLIDTGSEPYQKPYVPQNVKATCGENNAITISWDPVDGANLYIIEGIASSEFGIGQMEEYARTTEASYTFYLNGVGDGQPYRDFNAAESYIFAVKTYINFGSASDYLISDSSDYAEGCFAPPSIEFHASVTKSSLNLYWNLSNIFSALSTGSTPVALYNPDFLIEYRKSGDSEWKQITQEQYGGKDPWMFASLNVSEYSFEHEAEYDFRITMNLTEGVVNPTTLQSDIFSSIISDDLSVNSVLNLTASKGTYSDKVELTWEIPSWSQGATRDNSYFAVYRSEGTDISKAEVLVNEIEDNEHSSDITADGNSIKFTDDTAEAQRTYNYWVVNAAKDLDGLLHEQELSEVEDNYVEGYVFYPDISNLKGTFTVNEDGKSAVYSLSWDNNSSKFPDDLTLAIERSVWHSAYDRTDVDYISVDADATSYPNGAEEIKDNCSSHRYSYKLVIRKSDLKNNFYELGSFDLGEAVLGTIENMAFTDFVASDDFVDAIRISWKPAAGHEDDTYSYSIDDSEYKKIDTVGKENDTYFFVIADIKDNEEHEIKLKSGEYESPEARKGKRLVLPSDASVTATDGTSNEAIYITWKGFEAHNSNIEYVLLANNEKIADVRPMDGIYIVKKSDVINDRGEKYDFCIAAYNEKQGDGSYAYGSADSGYILPVPSIESVSKGDYADKVDIKWDASISDMVSGYKVYRSSSSDMSEGVEIASLSATDSSYTDILPDRYEEYYYGVVSFKDDVTSRFLTSDEIGKTPNILFENEANNLGYAFDTSLGDVTVTESIEDGTGYISDYFVVSVPVNKTVKEYKISSSFGKPEIYDVSNLVEMGNGIYGVANIDSGEAGYFYYDRTSKKIFFNSAVGIVGDDLRVSGITIQGSGGKDNDIPTNESFDTASYRRGFNEYDYIRLFNDAFTTAIESVKKKDSDWWNPWDNIEDSGDEYSFIRFGMVQSFTAEQTPGFIQFTGYVHNNLYSLTGEYESRIRIFASEEGDAGYLKTDPLGTIGVNNDGNVTTMHFLSSFIVAENPVKYKDADITVDNVIVRTNASNQGYGSYHIERADEKVFDVTIDSSNISNVPVKP